jgi:hypothetical protein
MMRRVGLILLAAGLAGFLFASAQRARHAASAKDASTPASETSRRAYESWETARWLLMGMAVMGAIFTVLPGKDS